MPLSAGQLSEWVHDRRIDGELSHEPTIVRLTGPLHTAALRGAYAELVRRHECLRTRYPVVGGEPVQVVEEPARDPLPLIDLSGLPREHREREAVRIGEEALCTPVPLDERPPVRLALIRMAPGDHLLLVGIPHITADLWSTTLLNDELMALYRAGSDGRPAPPAAAVAQYADYAIWQRGWWNEARTAAEAERWRARLAGLAAVELPLDRPRPPDRRRDCFVVDEELDAALSEELRAFARSRDMTLYVVLLAAFHCLVGRAGGAERLVTTSLVAARHGLAVQEMTGPFSDYLALVGDLSGDPDFLEVLRRVREEWLTAHEYQRLPFPEVVQRMDPARELHPHPLEQIGFDLHNLPPAVLDFAGDIAVSELELEPVEDGTDRVPWIADLSFDVYDYGTGLIPFHVILDGRLFDAASARAWADRYRAVLREVLADPAVRVSALKAVPAPERAGTVFGGRQIDVGRVERALESAGGVDAALVMVRQRRTGTGLRVRELVAYVAAGDPPGPLAHDLRERVRGSLPAGWMPTVLIGRPPAEIRRAVAARAAGADPADLLPAPEDCPWLPEGAPPPSDDVERRLAGLWAEALGAPPAGMTERFFRDGVGDKDAIAFLDRVADDLGIDVPFADFTAMPNLLCLKDIWLRNNPVTPIARVVESETTGAE
ncbi:condensation domain-containing protein [Streptomyces sp. NPDC053079]|uniref:condensation domain-containing protein n=1 Tax=Streptomyces sp. NPDC053079 TaxID=3365697 RepID=UPI0037CE5226